MKNLNALKLIAANKHFDQLNHSKTLPSNKTPDFSSEIRSILIKTPI